MAVSTSTEIGRRIASVRTLRGLTQAQVAEQAGVALNTVTRAEVAAVSPSLDTIVKIRGVLGCSLDYLIYGRGGPEEVQP